MKTKFAKEKSAYSRALIIFLDRNKDNATRNEAYVLMQTIEKYIKAHGDEITFIVTTRDTNPMKECTAPPMSEKDIKA